MSQKCHIYVELSYCAQLNEWDNLRVKPEFDDLIKVLNPDRRNIVNTNFCEPFFCKIQLMKQLYIIAVMLQYCMWYVSDVSFNIKFHCIVTVLVCKSLPVTVDRIWH